MLISGKTVAILSGIALAIGLAGSSFAADWEATKLRGSVLAQVGDDWVQLARGDVIPDDRIIHTESSGRVQFRRGNETIDLGPDTIIRILDRPGQTFTVVQQHFGEVTISAERQQVQHFAVQTKYLAAVVKGTRFTVIAGSGSAEVKVQQGRVQVRDVARGVMADITPGQSASAGISDMLEVSGAGDLPQIVHFTGQSLDQNVVAGKPVDRGTGNAFGLSKSGNGNAGSNGNSGTSNSGGNGNSSSNNAGGNGKGNSGSNNAGGNGNGNNPGSSGSDASSSPGKSGSAPGRNK